MILSMGADWYWPDTIGLSKHYFAERFGWIDTRGPITIAGDSFWGFFVTVITTSHRAEIGPIGPMVPRPVTVGSKAWIGSHSFLYNCTIGEGAIVAAGTVVRSCTVAPYVMIAGNPAKVIARWEDGQWNWLEERWKILA